MGLSLGNVLTGERGSKAHGNLTKGWRSPEDQSRL